MVIGAGLWSRGREHRRGEAGDAVRVDDDVDLDDLAFSDGEAQEGERPPVERDDPAGGPVDEDRVDDRGGIRAEPGLASDGGGAADDHGPTRAAGAEVGPG